MSSTKVQGHSCSKRGKIQMHKLRKFLSQRDLLLLFTQPVCISIPCSLLGKMSCTIRAVLKTRVEDSLGHLLLLKLSDTQLKGFVISLGLQPKQAREGALVSWKAEGSQTETGKWALPWADTEVHQNAQTQQRLLSSQNKKFLTLCYKYCVFV